MERSRQQIGWLIHKGVTFYLDLDDEASRFNEARYLEELFAQTGALGLEPVYENLPLSPHRTPRRREIRWVLDVIKEVLAAGFIVYIHSDWPDIRGTVAACGLVERGIGGVQALQTLEHLRREPYDPWRRVPAKRAFRRPVKRWGRDR